MKQRYFLRELAPGQRVRIAAFLVFIFAVKALGGSFHAVLSKLGIASIQGPLMGTLICIGLIWVFAKVLRLGNAWSDYRYSATKKQRRVAAVLFAILLAIAIGVRVKTIHNVTITKYQSDSLPTVLSGLEDVRQGRSPYHDHDLGDGFHPVHYFPPTLWAGFYPFYALGIDIRYYTILSQIISASLIIWLFLTRTLFPFPLWVSFFGTFTLLGVLLFSKVMLGTVATIHTATFGLTFSLLAFAMIRRHWWLVCAAVPIMLLSRETSVIMVIPLFAMLFRQSLKKFLTLLGISAAVVVPVMLLFILAPNSDFFAGPRFYSSIIHLQDGWKSTLPFFGLGPLINYLRLGSIQILLQIPGIVFSLAWIFRHRQISTAQWLALSGITYLPFILFVACNFQYLYIEPFWLVLFLLHCDIQPANG